MDSAVIKNDNSNQARNKAVEYVYIVDTKGIKNAFAIIKTKLSNETSCYLSVLYFSNESITHSLFKNEPEYLEKRFQHLLTVNIVDAHDELVFDSERLEVIINCSILENQQFIISGAKDFVELGVNNLLFLDINKNRIQTQIK